jgi:hypothetical protein
VHELEQRLPHARRLAVQAEGVVRRAAGIAEICSARRLAAVAGELERAQAGHRERHPILAFL